MKHPDPPDMLPAFQPDELVRASDPTLGVRLVQLRLALVLAATAFIAVITGAVLVSIVGPDPEHRLGMAIRSAPIPWLIAFVALFAGSCDLTILLARRVVQPARELDAARRHYGELYESERSHALEDSLTGLANHRAFQEEFDRQLDTCRRYGVPVALALIDLDDFKTVNDSAGHSVGDEVLLEMSRLLRSCVRFPDRPFRVGGDEFAVLMPHTSVENAYGVVRRLLSACLEPRPGSAFPRGFSFSAGVTAAPELGMSRTELFAQADEALYAGKREGRTTVRIYDPERSMSTLDAATLKRASSAVARLVEDRAIRAVYQPIVDVITGRVIGFEGLVRPTPESGFPNPGILFAAAEAAGRTAELDWLCIETVLAGATALAPDQSISMNISPQTIEAPEFSAAYLLKVLSSAGLAPDRLVLEVTERETVRDIEVLRRQLAACQASGMRIGIDDVGAGNAGLRLLSQIHFNIVKIDLSLVQAGARRDASLEVLRSLAQLTVRWGATAVAEGVETASQLRVIRDLGLPEAQGFLLGRPRPAPESRTVDVERLLRSSDASASLARGPHGSQSIAGSAPLGHIAGA